jgi:hypothetical protein
VHLDDIAVTLCSGTPVDATIIDAPSSTKNMARAGDREMSSTKKGHDWFFGVAHFLETSTCPNEPKFHFQTGVNHIRRLVVFGT